MDFGLCDIGQKDDGYLDNKKKTLKEIKESMEKIVIVETLLRNDWNISRSSKELGISRWTLNNKIKKYKIKRLI